MADGHIGETGVGELGLVVLDETDNGAGVGTDASLVGNASDRVTVKILGTDGDTNDQVGKVVAKVGQAGAEGSKLIVDTCGARSPDAQEDGGVGLHSSLESLDRGVCGAALDVGVQTDGVEGAGGALELGSIGELGHPVSLVLVRAICVG